MDDVDAFIITALDASFRTKDDTAHTTTVLYKSTPAQAYEHKCAVARRAHVSFHTHVSTAPPDERRTLSQRQLSGTHCQVAVTFAVNNLSSDAGFILLDKHALCCIDEDFSRRLHTTIAQTLLGVTFSGECAESTVRNDPL